MSIEQYFTVFFITIFLVLGTAAVFIVYRFAFGKKRGLWAIGLVTFCYSILIANICGLLIHVFGK